MPLTAVKLSASIGWTFSRAITGFLAGVQGPDGKSFNLNGIDLTVYTELLAANYSIANGAHTDYDLSSFTNLENEAANFLASGALAVVLLPTVGAIAIGPGASNGLVWFFGSASDKTTVKAGGCFVLSNPVAGPGQTVDGTHKILTLTNTSGSTASGFLFVLGG